MTLPQAAGKGESLHPGRLVRSAVLAMFRRDMAASRRQFFAFVIMTLLQPLFFLYVFGRVLPAIGFASGQYPDVLIPGIMGLCIFLAGLQGMAFEVGMQFAQGDIDDRLLSPVPTWLIPIQQTISGSLRGVVAGLVVLGLGPWIAGVRPGAGEWNWGLLILVLCLAALGGSALGLMVGTLMRPHNIGPLLGLVMLPLAFLGGPYYPWAMLAQFPVLKGLALINPLMYTCEALRHALATGIPTMAIQWAIVGQVASFLLLLFLGTKGFIRRALE